MLRQRRQIKQTLIARIPAVRQTQPALFAKGDYLPLQINGPHSKYVIAFLRRHQGQALSIAAFRLPPRGPLPNADGGTWDGTELLLPGAMSGWRNALSPDAAVALNGERIALGSLLGRRPVAVLLAGGPEGWQHRLARRCLVTRYQTLVPACASPVES